MNRPIDTLFYHWVADEQDKQIPTIFEDINDLDDATKIDAILTTYAEHVGYMIESEIMSRMIIDAKVQQVQEDDELFGEDEELLARAIEEDEDVMEAEANVEASKNALNLLHSSIVKVFSREV